jgi:seryl-tRNA synthetase
MERTLIGPRLLALFTTFVYSFAVHRATDSSGEKMKPTLVLALALSLSLVTGSAFAQSSTSSELKELKDAIAAQQQQIQQLQQQVQSRDSAIQQLQQQVGQAQSTATDAQKAAAAAALAQAPKSEEEINALGHQVTDLKAVSANTVEGLQDTQKRVSDLESPLALHFKGITLTPGGFLAGETVWRPHATLGFATPLNAIPFSAAAQARTSEFYGSGSQ